MTHSTSDDVTLLREIAARILSGDVPPVEGVREICAHSGSVEDHPAVLTFYGINSITDHIPQGAVRKTFAADYLAKADQDIPERRILDACCVLLEQLK